ELTARRTSTCCSARRVVLVPLATELRALRLEHRADGLEPELVNEGEKIAADQGGEREQQLRQQRRLVPRRFLGRLLHGGSPWKHPEIPSGPGGTATLNFQQSAGRRPGGPLAPPDCSVDPRQRCLTKCFLA